MKRFIRYLYEYDRGKRLRNVGFVKVEQGEDDCTVHIHGKGLHMRGERKLSLYLFYCENGECIGICQGTADNVNPAINYRLHYTKEDVIVPENFQKINGLVLESETGHKYAAIWNDSPVDVEHMRVLRPEDVSRKEDRQRETSEQRDEPVRREAPVPAEESNQGEAPVQGEESKPREESLRREESKQREEFLRREESKQREEPLRREESKQREESLHREESLQREESKPREESLQREENKPREESLRREESNQREAPMQEETASEGEPLQSENAVGRGTLGHEEEPQKRERPEKGEELSEQRREDTPIIGASQERLGNEDSQKPMDEQQEDISQASKEQDAGARFGCRKIQRNDLARLPRCEWKLANNSFLLHGYYNYHHLALINEGEKFMIGVPGIYHPQEAKAASTFGFAEFVPYQDTRMDLTDDEKSNQEQFGYWCRQVRRPLKM